MLLELLCPPIFPNRGGGFSRISSDLFAADSDINFIVGGGGGGGNGGGAGSGDLVAGGAGGSVDDGSGASVAGQNGANSVAAGGGLKGNAAAGGFGGLGGLGGSGTVDGASGSDGQTWTDGGQGGLAGFNQNAYPGRAGSGGGGYGGGGGGAGGVGPQGTAIAAGGGGASGSSHTAGVSDNAWDGLNALAATGATNGQGGTGGVGVNQNGASGASGYAQLVWLSRTAVHATATLSGAELSWAAVAPPSLPSGFATFGEIEYDVLVDGAVVETTTDTTYNFTGQTPGSTVDVEVLAKSQSTPGSIPLDTEISTKSASLKVTVLKPTPNPSSKTKQTVAAKSIPKKVKKRGLTVLNKRNAKTKQGRPLTAKANARFTRGELRCFKLTRGKQRKLTIRTYGKCSFTLRVTYTAPGNSKLRAYKKVKTYRVKR